MKGVFSSLGILGTWDSEECGEEEEEKIGRRGSWL